MTQNLDKVHRCFLWTRVQSVVDQNHLQNPDQIPHILLAAGAGHFSSQLRCCDSLPFSLFTLLWSNFHGGGGAGKHREVVVIKGGNLDVATSMLGKYNTYEQTSFMAIISIFNSSRSELDSLEIIQDQIMVQQNS